MQCRHIVPGSQVLTYSWWLNTKKGRSWGTMGTAMQVSSEDHEVILEPKPKVIVPPALEQFSSTGLFNQEAQDNQVVK